MMSRPPQPTLTKTGKRRRYPDDFRAAALLMLEGAGWPDKKGALTTVANHLSVPVPTLSRWARQLNNPPAVEVVTEKRVDFAQAIRDEMAAIIGDFDHTRPDANYKDLVTAFAILFDKHQLITGGSTENVNQRVLIAYHDDDGPA